MEKDNKYTLENLTSSISENHVYCLNIKNGNISIGKIIGISALTNTAVVVIEGRFYTIVDGQLNQTSFKINNNLICYFSYQEFLDYCTTFFKCKKEKKLCEKAVTKYIVDKASFICTITKAKQIPYDSKVFYTKNEAIEYSKKSLKRLKKQLEIYSIAINELKEKVHRIYFPDSFKYSVNSILSVGPEELKENDLLIKVELKQFGDRYHFPVLKENYVASVKKIISNNIAILNDGTLLLENEAHGTASYFAKYDSLECVKRRNKYTALQIIRNDLSVIEESLPKVIEHCEKYVPFEGNSYIKFWINPMKKGFIENVINGINEFLNYLNQKKDEE